MGCQLSWSPDAQSRVVGWLIVGHGAIQSMARMAVLLLRHYIFSAMLVVACATELLRSSKLGCITTDSHQQARKSRQHLAGGSWNYLVFRWSAIHCNNK